LKYDEVLNRQRLVIYAERREVLEGKDISDQIQQFFDDTVEGYVTSEMADSFEDEWDLDRLETALREIYPMTVDLEHELEESGQSPEFLAEVIKADVQRAYADREQQFGPQVMRELERKVVLSVLDRKWREHLYEMQYLQEGIGLRAMAQKDPLVEYQREGYDLFAAMMDSFKEEVVGFLFNVKVDVQSAEDGDEVEVVVAGAEAPAPRQLQYVAPSESGEATTARDNGERAVTRNALCPCGSGKKYKRCHGDVRNN
jgi:preprotein translocase subunit SecA